MDDDFGFNGDVNSEDTAPVNNTNEEVTNLDNDEVVNEVHGQEAANLDNDSLPVEEKEEKKDKKPADKEATTKYEAGTAIEVGDSTYTFDEDGNLRDSNGSIFKEANEVADWLKEFDTVEDDNSSISVKAIQDAIGITITDDKNKPITYEDSVEGIKSYVQDVIENSRQEHYQTAIDTLYAKYPIVEDFLNYYIANGNSFKGFGEMPDRSNITIDSTNEAQQESIIRTAWEEQGRRGNVDSYLQYLKSSGTLLAVATEELEALKQADKDYRDKLAEDAQKREEEEHKKLVNYWTNVQKVIKGRKIAGYEIPEQIIVNRDGQKITTTPEDFFNYLYRVNKDGYSQYQLDLAKQTPESKRDDEILRAYLTYVGGNYSNLVSIAINKEKVAKLRLVAKERNAKPNVRITKPTNTNKKDIDLGYN